MEMEQGGGCFEGKLLLAAVQKSFSSGRSHVGDRVVCAQSLHVNFIRILPTGVRFPAITDVTS